MTGWQLSQIVRCLRDGGVIAYPTESVYGLGCDPLNHTAVLRILDLKQRDISKGLILIAAHQQQLAPYIGTLPPEIQAKLDDTWPGPFTWLLPAMPNVPEWIRGAHNTIAVRVTKHPIASAICAAVGHPLISTSANISRRAPARTALAVRTQFPSGIDRIISGAVGQLHQPTPIRDAITGQSFRK